MEARKLRYRKRLRTTEAAGVSVRFKTFVGKVYGSWEEFERRTGVKPTTYGGWRRKKGANLPGLDWLIPIAKDSGLALDWLLLGEGEMLRQRPVSTPEEAFLARLEAELRATEGVSAAEADVMWSRILRDRSGVWRLAVEGVRPTFRENIEGLRLAVEASEVVRQATEGLLRSDQIVGAIREVVHRRLGALMDHSLGGERELQQVDEPESRS